MWTIDEDVEKIMNLTLFGFKRFGLKDDEGLGNIWDFA